RHARDTFGEKLRDANKLLVPALKHMTAGAPLGQFLLDEPLIRPLPVPVSTLDGQWIGRFMEQLNAVIVKLRRIHFKSLGGILALQEKIGSAWLEQTTPGELGAPRPVGGAVQQPAS